MLGCKNGLFNIFVNIIVKISIFFLLGFCFCVCFLLQCDNKFCQNETNTVKSQSLGCSENNDTKQGKVNSFYGENIRVNSKLVKRSHLEPRPQRQTSWPACQSITDILFLWHQFTTNGTKTL